LNSYPGYLFINGNERLVSVIEETSHVRTRHM